MAPKVVNVAMAKATLPELIERAAGGEVIILARAGKPRAQLVPIPSHSTRLRVPGKGKGRFGTHESVGDPLPDAVLALFEAVLPEARRRAAKAKKRRVRK